MLGALPPGVSRCQRVPPAARLHQAGDHRLFQAAPRTALARTPLAAQVSELPLGMIGSLAGAGRPALCSGVDLLCDFWMSHLASLGITVFPPTPPGKWEESKLASLCRCGKVKSARKPHQAPGAG